MREKLGLIALVLWIATIGALGFFFVHGWTSESSDRRTAIHLAPGERDLVLAEMRQMLHSVHNLVTGLSAGDRKIMEQAARASGMGMAVDVNPIIMAKLPLAFKQQGMSVHHDFDALADTIAQGADQATVLREFTGITARCVGCHVSYRLP
jgi:ABC-type proline/glycine betaine transport system permease subunit